MNNARRVAVSWCSNNPWADEHKIIYSVFMLCSAARGIFENQLTVSCLVVLRLHFTLKKYVVNVFSVANYKDKKLQFQLPIQRYSSLSFIWHLFGQNLVVSKLSETPLSYGWISIQEAGILQIFKKLSKCSFQLIWTKKLSNFKTLLLDLWIYCSKILIM